MAMEWTTGLVLLLWQAVKSRLHHIKLWQLVESRRFRRRQDAFWRRHEKNMEAIRSGVRAPYPSNSHDWPKEEKKCSRSGVA